jgi:SAM-dependent methyltransferase
VLASDLDAHVTAVDFLPPFLARLEQTARERGVAGRITTLAASMDELDFDDGSLDVIWSEGAIYNIDFEHGLRSWRRFLRPGGISAVSEITWLTDERPAELEDRWNAEYPEDATASAKLAVLEAAGYTPIGYFPLPPSCWLDHYYGPMQARFAPFLEMPRRLGRSQRDRRSRTARDRPLRTALASRQLRLLHRPPQPRLSTPTRSGPDPGSEACGQAR